MDLVELLEQSRSIAKDERCRLVLTPPLLDRLALLSDSLGLPHDSEAMLVFCVLRKQMYISTKNLKLSQRSVASYNGDIDITDFMNLRTLYLHKIPVCKLRAILSNLVLLSCVRCDLANIWSLSGLVTLKTLVLNYCNVEEVDNQCFKNMPSLETLDLSYNYIKSVPGLRSLEKIKNLKLTFNYLKEVPTLSDSANRILEVLYVNNNHLQSLHGIEKFTSLKELNASGNIICSLSQVSPVSKLSGLKRIQLAGNPISFEKRYRLLIVPLLSPSSQDLVFDQAPLSNLEKTVLGTRVNAPQPPLTASTRLQPQRVTDLRSSRPDAKTRSSKRQPKVRTIHFDEETEDSFVKVSLHIPSTPEEPSGTSSPPQDVKLKEESETAVDPKSSLLQTAQSPDEPSSSAQRNLRAPKTPTEALPSSEYVLDSDDEFPSVTQNVEVTATVHMPVEDAPYENSELSIDDLHDQLLSHLEKSTEDLLRSNQSQLADLQPEEHLNDSKTPLEEKNNVDYDESLNRLHEECTSDKSLLSEVASTDLSRDYETAVSENHESLDTTIKSDDFNSVQSSDANQSDLSVGNGDTVLAHPQEDSSSESNTSINSEEDTVEDEELLWLVQRVDGSIEYPPLFLVLLNNELKERSTLNTRTVNKWPLSSIQSCVKVKNDPVTVELEFKTLQKENMKRTYVMEHPDAKSLIEKVSDILESKTLSEMNQKIYECLVCGTVFVHEVVEFSKVKELKCPVCRKGMVVEKEEPQLPSVKVTPEKQISHSPSQSSIASSSTSSGIKTKIKGFSSQTSSDVEVISSRSQSSVEVIDDNASHTSTPIRKRSKEEKYNVRVSVLPEEESPAPAFSTLTESSSSESVVTAYSNNNGPLKKGQGENYFSDESNEFNGPFSPEEATPDISSSTYDDAPDPDGCDIYNFEDFTSVDTRIQGYLYSSVFHDKHEKLLLLAKGLLWKTGGKHLEACVALSSSSFYILSHQTLSDYGEDASEWLSMVGSHSLKEVKKVFAIAWYQGVGILVNQIYYLMLLHDTVRTKNLIASISGLNLKGLSIDKTPSETVENTIHSLLSNADVGDVLENHVIHLFTICQKLSIYRNEECDEVMSLAGVAVTGSHVFVIAGDLTWLTPTNSFIKPSIQSFKPIKELVFNNVTKDVLKLHFHSEFESHEDVWHLKLPTESEVQRVSESVQKVWFQNAATMT